MKIYLGNNGTLEIFEMMEKNGWGNVHLANDWRYPKPGISWFLDNGAYSYWKNNLPFNSKKFESAIEKLEMCCSNPDFIVVPDLVAQGLKSLYFSLGWIHRISAGYDIYLAVQDGMTVRDVFEYIDFFDGLFVGGTLNWKLKTGKTWVDVAHSQDKPCHIGRVGTFRRLVWARNIGADSIDSSTFQQAKPGTGFKRIKAALSQTYLY